MCNSWIDGRKIRFKFLIKILFKNNKKKCLFNVVYDIWYIGFCKNIKKLITIKFNIFLS